MAMEVWVMRVLVQVQVLVLVLVLLLMNLLGQVQVQVKPRCTMYLRVLSLVSTLGLGVLGRRQRPLRTVLCPANPGRQTQGAAGSQSA